ncbi:hypothetical protein FocTR4_00005105 [Fusarium oxysporum f. sp. cubense]|uniref:Uncharacterized protein n=1 Tax=Fusarium oxysporum f. sp. cubense TaxID=61366 RepID=A0A5C6THQ0_FUSOC|nr:hypothetical protein H9L39_06888 [Fusarium oxysporum f. sp. albedinis]TXC10306.1 hypothetical protein FocTR4_00005105 [Fusarium oxysporum f. sp. cubense]
MILRTLDMDAINFPPEFGPAREGQEAPRGPFNGYGKAHKRTWWCVSRDTRPTQFNSRYQTQFC